MDCSICQEDETFKDVWACETPSHDAVWEDGESVYYSCPLRFIPDNIILFINEMNYNKTYNINKPFVKQCAKYIDAENEYRYWVNYYRDEVDSMRKRK